MSFTVKFVKTEWTEETQQYDDGDAYLFLPGGVLGVFVGKEKRVSFYTPGSWLHVSGKEHQPGYLFGLGGVPKVAYDLFQPVLPPIH
ncbi:hypothetical protein [Mycobacteroides franklinii]|uniref:hypothetical protein n=1 Tax=Mycobacteroides franklinii TaxID=948102 RepID=UPI00099253F5|nr:hypothetical protein [Mycobacteroides franklinii]ORA64122.1 hypothetical protein BST24_02840 [Mycobacteroides franklinii]